MELRGALAALERRAQEGAPLYNEFDEEPPVRFEADRTILPPNFSGGMGQRTIIEVRIGSSYTIFREDNGEAMVRAERTAMHMICRCLYQDVIDDLLIAMKAVGEGKRQRAMQLLSDLCNRLNGRD